MPQLMRFARPLAFVAAFALLCGLCVVFAPLADAHGGGWNPGPPPPPPAPPKDYVPPPPPPPDNTPAPPPPAPAPPTDVEELPPPTTGGGTPTPPPPPPPPTTDNPPPEDDDDVTTPEAPPPDEDEGPPLPPMGDEDDPVTGAPPPGQGDDTGKPDDKPEPPPAPPEPPFTPKKPDMSGGTGPVGPAAPSVPMGAGGRPAGRTAVRNLDTQWTLWWDLNRWQYFPSRADVLQRKSEKLTGKDAGETMLRAFEARRNLLTKSVALPYLWRVLSPVSKAPEEVQAAALIALARVAQNPEAIDLVLHHALNPRNSQLIRESATIALGHFRRSSDAARFDSTRLDLLRIQLLKIIDDLHIQERPRAFAALSLGLLGDQPFGRGMNVSGRLVTRELWERLSNDRAGYEVSVAMLTAIGMQPAEGVPEGVRDGLAQIALGKRLGGRRWSSVERSHSLTARVKLGGKDWPAVLSRILGSRHVTSEVRRAGFIAMTGGIPQLEAAGRFPTYEAWQAGMRRAKDPLTRGLGYIALARLLAAEMDDPDSDERLTARTDATQQLMQRASSGDVTLRGFGAVALGIAARSAGSKSIAQTTFRTKALALLSEQLRRGKGDDELTAAYAVGLGLIGDDSSIEQLAEILRDRARSPSLRGRCAVSLAQIGVRSPRVMVALQAALMDRRDSALRAEAALALSFLAEGNEAGMLVRDLEKARSQYSLAQTALALGRMGQLSAVKAMLGAARNTAHNDEPRALAVAAMGLILNPEERPTLSRIRFNANYPARTVALHEVFDIL